MVSEVLMLTIYNLESSYVFIASGHRCSLMPAGSADAEHTSESGAAAAALSALASASEAYHLRINTAHPALNQYRTRPKPREDGGAC